MKQPHYNGVIAFSNKETFLLDLAKKYSLAYFPILGRSKFAQFYKFFMIMRSELAEQVRVRSVIEIDSVGFFPGLFVSLFSLILNTHSYKYRCAFYHAHFRIYNLNHYLQSKKIHVFLDKLIIRTCDIVFVLSASARDILILEGCPPSKIVIREYRLDKERIEKYQTLTIDKTSTKSRCVELLAVGRLDWQKNYPFMFRSLFILKEQGVRFHLSIYGQGSDAYTEQLQNLAIDYDLTNEISFKGYSHEIEMKMLASDILVHTAIDEGFGLVLAEAIVLGIPIASTWMGGSSSLSRFMVDSICQYNEEAFAIHLYDVIQNINKYRKRLREQIKLREKLITI